MNSACSFNPRWKSKRLRPDLERVLAHFNGRFSYIPRFGHSDRCPALEESRYCEESLMSSVTGYTEQPNDEAL